MKYWLTFAFLASFCVAQELPSGTAKLKVNVRLVDEDGHPLAGFPCEAGFCLPGKTWDAYKQVSQKGKTGEDGVFSAEGVSMNTCGFASKPDGYYGSSKTPFLNEARDKMWLPYPRNETLVLKKIGRPAPMYAMARARLVLPDKEGTFGYDLEKADWVAPHGEGATADLLFTQQKKEDSIAGSKAKLIISFSNAGDGIIPLYDVAGTESELRLPRFAPEKGYESRFERETTWTYNSQHAQPSKPADGFIFRVRASLNADGTLKSAWYGKIDGDFDWDPRNEATGVIIFTYYLNPDGTNNLEFDRSRNLFGKLPSRNTVKNP